MATLLFSGPSSGARGVASPPFTVQVPPGVSLGIPGSVTPSDSGAGGTFTPAVATMPTGQGASCTFTYTPAYDGNLSISITNSFGATNPAPLTYTVPTTLSFFGPSGGLLNRASVPFFQVLMPAGPGLFTAGVVTASDSGHLGTFIPAVAQVMPTGVGAGLGFTYTPAVQGPVPLSITTTFGGSAPPLTYQVGVTPSFGTIPALSKNPGSSDTVPVYYPVQRTVQRLFNQGRRYIPYYATIVLQTPTYAPMDIRGPGQEYTRQSNVYGLVAMKIVYSRVGAKFAPAYVTVDINGLIYKIQPFQVVTVPRIVFDVLNQSSDYGAVIVP